MWVFLVLATVVNSLTENVAGSPAIYVNGNSLGNNNGYTNIGGNGWNPVNSNSYSTNSYTTSNNGMCVKHITVQGRGVSDSFDSFPCDTSNYIMGEELFIGARTSVRQYSIYGKRDRTFQVIEDGKCSKRTYVTVDGKTSVTKTAVIEKACEEMKEEHAKKLDELIKYWEEWSQKTFPPCFPFCNGNRPGTQKPVMVKPQTPVMVKPQMPVIVKPQTPAIVNPKTPVMVKPNYQGPNGLDWGEWAKQTFPPCFPFCY